MKMDLRTVLSEVETWPPEDRLRLIEVVWDGLSEQGDDPEIGGELARLLEQRMLALRENPDDVLTWDEIKAHVRRPR